jgi:RNA polymerase sigma-70 factor (ECF subfamily)
VCPPARSDPQLLAAHRAGDGRAFGELAERHHGRLWAVAVRILHHPEDAADAVQEALVAAYRGAHTYRGDATVRTWLTRILLNRCLDRLRRDRGRVELRLDGVQPGHPGPRTGDLATELVTRLSVREALEVLPSGQRLAVVLVDVQGWSVAEVAELLEIPVGTVKSRCARGRARLAALLGHLRTEEPG